MKLQGCLEDTGDVNDSKLVFAEGPERNFAYWSIHQTLQGSFFRFVVDHDGETILQKQPLSNDETRTLLELNAPHLVEQYFGG